MEELKKIIQNINILATNIYDEYDKYIKFLYKQIIISKSKNIAFDEKDLINSKEFIKMTENVKMYIELEGYYYDKLRNKIKNSDKYLLDAIKIIKRNSFDINTNDDVIFTIEKLICCIDENNFKENMIWRRFYIGLKKIVIGTGRLDLISNVIDIGDNYEDIHFFKFPNGEISFFAEDYGNQISFQMAINTGRSFTLRYEYILSAAIKTAVQVESTIYELLSLKYYTLFCDRDNEKIFMKNNFIVNDSFLYNIDYFETKKPNLKLFNFLMKDFASDTINIVLGNLFDLNDSYINDNPLELINYLINTYIIYLRSLLTYMDESYIENIDDQVINDFKNNGCTYLSSVMSEIFKQSKEDNKKINKVKKYT